MKAQSGEPRLTNDQLTGHAKLAYRNRVLNHVANKPFLTLITPVQEATQIWADPIDMLTASGVESGNNWGKIYYARSEDTGEGGGIYVFLNFYFYWQNQFDDVVVILNATSELSPLGYIEGTGNSGIFGGDGEVFLYGNINAYVGDHYSGGNLAVISSVNGESSPFWGLGGTNSDHATTTLYGNPYRFSMLAAGQPTIEVERDQVAVFEVSLEANISIYNGNAGLDFNSRDYSVVCPGINLEIFVPPVVKP